MDVAEAVAFISFEDFLELERDGEVRHEYVGGRLYAMSGGTERHDLAAILLHAQLLPGALARGCRPFTFNRLFRTPSGNGYYPDVLIACGPAPHPRHETDPVVVVEVLSPSTYMIDRREKAIAYAQCRSVKMILLVDPNIPRIEIARPRDGVIGSWDVQGPGGIIFTDFGTITVDDLYGTLDRTATAF